MNKSPVVIAIFIIAFTFLLGPFLVILITAFSGDSSMAFPPNGFSLEWFQKVLAVRSFRDAFWISLGLGAASTTSVILLGTPVAYALVRFNFRGRDLVEVLFSLPVIVPELVLGFALLRYFVLFGNLPILMGLYLGHTAILFPFAVRVVSTSLRNFDPAIEEAAISLGASRLRSFLLVVLPNLSAAFLATFILAFITSFNNVSVSLFLTGPGITTLPISMLGYMEQYFDPTIAALSSVLIVITFVIVQLAERLLGISRMV
jgi:putative spermidine/putrescine transport system permease protein